MKLPDKHAVHRALRASLEQALATMVAAANETREGATHEENRSEGDKDMRATEQSYLARGQAMRAEQLGEEVSRFAALAPIVLDEDAPIVPGALVHVDIDGEGKTLFIVPQGGGTVLDVDGHRVTVITPASPLGRALLGKRAGDDFELRTPTTRDGEVVAVS